MRFYIYISLVVLLTSCGGPLSVLPYVASAGLGAYDTHQRQLEAERKHYVDACLPIDRRQNPLFLGVRAEREAAHIAMSKEENKLQKSQRKLIEAYAYYRIAQTLADVRADARLVNIKRFMSDDLKVQGENEFKRYTLANILSCYNL